MPSLIPTLGIFAAALAVAILWAKWDLKRQQAKRLFEQEDES